MHHVLTFPEQDEDEEMPIGLAESAHDVQHGAGLFVEWAVGKAGEIFVPGAGKITLPGAKIRWEVHMYAIGREVNDNQVELGIYFIFETKCPSTARCSARSTPRPTRCSTYPRVRSR